MREIDKGFVLTPGELDLATGASGDLAPLAHISAVLIGEGEASCSRGSACRGPRPCARPGLSRWCWAPRKGLATFAARRVTDINDNVRTILGSEYLASVQGWTSWPR